MAQLGKKKDVVLVVEDDPHGRIFLESSLDLSGFRVIVTQSAEEAQKTCEDIGLDSLSAVISDYRLPGENGIEFLKWIRERDPEISTLIITGQGEKSIVEASLSAGAYEYIEKPVTHQKLRRILLQAVQKTSTQRKYRDDQKGLQALEHLDQRLNVVIPESLQNRLKVFYKPLHEIGGDFLVTHDFKDGRWVILVGDISGHDIRSGFVSTYFQGMFQGCVDRGGSIDNAIELFNRSIRQQMLSKESLDEPVSLSLSAIQFDSERQHLRHWNFGLTPALLVSGNGWHKQCSFGRFPLGWVEEIDSSPELLSLKENAAVYIFTDGLSDFANNLEINPFCLLYRILHPLNEGEDLILEPSDDILALRFLLKPETPLQQTFEPILSEHYAGTEVDHIDNLQSNWRRSVNFALGDRLGDRLYDLLICVREGMLNALVHGCERSPEKFAHLQISINDSKDLLRVYIDDPGKGHQFDLEERLNEIRRETGKHLGLGIIHHLSDEFAIENKGTSLIFDFAINPDDV
ncbi:MAG: response regulator [Puniceicoccaceae bacterium]